MITLCTGSRDPVNMWKWHPDNDSKEAWDDMVRSIETALIAAEKNNLILAFEPESENVANSSTVDVNCWMSYEILAYGLLSIQPT